MALFVSQNLTVEILFLHIVQGRFIRIYYYVRRQRPADLSKSQRQLSKDLIKLSKSPLLHKSNENT